MSGTLVLGVDGGNTKTVAVVAATDGTVLGAGRAGLSDIYNAADEDAALAEVRRAVTCAFEEAGVSGVDLAASVFSMAGADWPEDFDFLRLAFADFGFGRRIVIVNDAIGALRAGTPDGVGVVIACGTGIAIGARNERGETWYSGHWPVATGGAELGTRALHAVYEAHLGLGPRTTLEDDVLDFFGVATVEDALHRCTARGFGADRPRQSELAPALLDHADRGDEVARSIVFAAGARNADVAIMAARKLGLDRGPFTLVLTGGVLRHPSRLLAEAIRARIESKLDEVESVEDPPEPVVGAILLAMDELKLKTGGAVVERLVETLPGPDLFKTCR